MELETALNLVDEISKKYYSIAYNTNEEITEDEIEVLKDIAKGVKTLILNFPNKEVKGELMFDKEIEARFAEDKICIDYELFYRLYKKDEGIEESLAYKMRNLAHPDYQINLGTYNGNKTVYGWAYFDMADILIANGDVQLENPEYKFSKRIEQDSKGNTSITFMAAL